MSFTKLKKKFIPLGAWSPDAPEFAPGFLDQIVNVIPVYGIYRTLQKLVTLSVGPPERRVTGTYVHRISIDQTIDPMQPIYAEPPNITGIGVKEGFQTVPALIGTEKLEFWQALRGLTADAASTVLFIPTGDEESLYGYFAKGVKVWDAVSDMFASFQYRISPGFIGSYEFWVEIGMPGDQGNPAEPTGFTPLVDGTFNQAGLLEDDVTDLTVVTLTIPNSSFADPGNANYYAFRFRHNIDLVAVDPDDSNQVVLEATTVATAAFTDPAHVFGYAAVTEAGVASRLAADFPEVLTVLVAGEWPDPPPIPFPGDLSAIVSDPIRAGATGVGFYFRPTFPEFISHQGHRIRIRWSVDRTQQRVSIGLFQGRRTSVNDQRPPLQVWNLPAASAVWPTVIETSLNDVGAYPDANQQTSLDRITDWDDVWIFFFAHPPSALPVPTVTKLLPVEGYEEVQGPWQVLPALSDPIEILSDEDDTTGLRQPVFFNRAEQASFRARMGPFTRPMESVTKIEVCFSGTNSDADERLFVKMSLLQPTNPNQQGGWVTPDPIEVFYHLGIPMNVYKATVPLDVFDTLDNLTMVVRREPGEGILNVADIWIEVTTGITSSARLHAFAYYGPKSEEDAAAPIDVSWLKLDGPADASDIQQDSLRAYLGTVEEPTSATQVGRIYEVESPDFSTWVDVSKVAGYFSNKRDKSWSFCNFGSMVVATNYGDPVQVKYEGEALFTDLIGFDTGGIAIPDYVADGGVYPRARFAATINAFLCIANCDPTSVVGTATPYSFWCSRYGAPQYFHVGLAEWQSSVFQLVSTPGEITGLVGGEYGFVFKENSIWRADYVRLPEIFNFTQLSGEQGTVQPRSIVKVDNDVYFWGIGGIYVIRDGSELQEIAGQGSVRKFLFDTQFEKFAVSSFQPGLESEAAVKVVGGYDTYTGCIFWCFQSRAADGEWFKCDSMLIYSPRENRFTFSRGDMTDPNFPTDRMISAPDMFPDNDLKLSGFLSLGNRQTEGQTYLMKTILVVRDIPPEIASFASEEVYETLYRSNTVSSNFFGAPTGVEIEIQKVRPIFAIENTELSPRYGVWIEGNQSPTVGNGLGVLRFLDTGNPDPALRATPNSEGWIDLGNPVSGEFFKFAMAFAAHDTPLVKEVHGWQVIFRIAGDR